MNNNTLVKIASCISLIIAVVIMLIKSYAWFITESQSILASLIDSFFDISSSILNLIAIRIALLPPDDNHKFGHEKFQDLAIFLQSVFFLSSSSFTILGSLKALFFYSEIKNLELGINIMYFCSFLIFILICFQSYVVYKTKSKIIAVDKLHYSVDFISSIGVIISFHLSKYYYYADALSGIIISLYVMHPLYGMCRESIRNLADEELSKKEKDKIISILFSCNQVKGLHELKTRHAGSKTFIQFHLELDGNISLYRSHEIVMKITNSLLLVFPEAEVIIHQDPVGLRNDVNYYEKI